jgi:hypothetical protein
MIDFLIDPSTWEGEVVDGKLETPSANLALKLMVEPQMMTWLKEHANKTGMHPITTWVSYDLDEVLRIYAPRTNMLSESRLYAPSKGDGLGEERKRLWQFTTATETLLTLSGLGVNLDESIPYDEKKKEQIGGI